jgi:hypothetical protein
VAFIWPRQALYSIAWQAQAIPTLFRGDAAHFGMRKLAKAANRASYIRSLIQRALIENRSASRQRENSSARRDLTQVLEADYVRVVRKQIEYSWLKALVQRASEVWPGFNQRPLQLGRIDQLRHLARSMGVKLRASAYRERDGGTLRGFYLPADGNQLREPVIHVNTAHHRLAVGTAFCHEVGHHLAQQVLGDLGAQPRFSFGADYGDHLRDAVELAADVVVSLAAYPEPIARRLFPERPAKGLVVHNGTLTPSILRRIESHLNARYPFKLALSTSQTQSLRYAAGAVHYAKLRWALLTEYEI